jgi:intein/homing endonuclease
MSKSKFVYYPQKEDPDFYREIHNKKEFYINRQSKISEDEKKNPDAICRSGDKFRLLPHQKLLKNLISPDTPYNNLLVMHSTGSGKCLLPDQKIYANGELVPIAEVWENNMDPDNTFIDEDPNADGYWSFPKNNIWVNTINKITGKMERTLVSTLYRQKIDEDIKVVTLDNGTVIKLTQKHKLLTETGWSTDFKNNQFVAYPKKIINENSYFVTPQLAYLLGWQIAEGYERKNKRTIYITNTDQDVLKNLIWCVKQVGEHYNLNINNPKIHNNDKWGRVSDIQINSIDYVNFLIKNGYNYGNTSAGKCIPEIIMNSSKEILKFFLRAFFDAESHVHVKKRQIEITSASEQIIHQLVFLLKMFGITMNIKTKMACATNGSKIMRQYYLGFVSSENARKFNEEIGFEIDYKKNNLAVVCQVPTNPNKPDLAVNKIIKEIRNVTQLPHYLFINNTYTTKDKEPSEITLRRIIANLEKAKVPECHHEFLKSKIELLKSRFSCDYRFTKIKKVEIIRYTGYVYDLEVPVHHNYAADNVMCHNTRSAISIAEGFKNYIRTMNENGIPARIYIISSSEARDNFRDTLLYPCDENNAYITPKECEELKYLANSPNPKLREKYYQKEKKIYKRLTNKKYDGYYKFMSYKKFQNKTIGERDKSVVSGSGEAPKHRFKPPSKSAIKNIDNSILIIDEAHNITENDWGRGVKWILRRSKNVRVILMSATPMMHKPLEIVKLLNFLRVESGDHIKTSDIFEGPKDSKLKPDGLQKISEYSRGYISYLRGLNPYSFPKRIEEGTIPQFKSLPPDRQLKYTPLVQCTMSSYQYETYKENDNGKFNASIKNIVDIVYPNPDGDKTGLHDPKILHRLEHTPEGKKFLKDHNIRFIKNTDTDSIEIDGDFLNMQFIHKYSAKFHRLLLNLSEQINKNVGKAFIYSNYVQSVGVFLIKRMLIRNGYEEYSFTHEGISTNPHTKCYYCGITQEKHEKHINELKKKLKQDKNGEFKPNADEETVHEYYPAMFFTLTGKGDKIIGKKLIDKFNSAENNFGKFVKIIIGSPRAREAIDFKGIRTIHIMNYPRNYSTIEQIIGRGIRHCSHAILPTNKRNVKIYRYVSSLPNKQAHSIEERKYVDGEKTHIVIKSIERVLKENAVDCTLNMAQNIFEEEYKQYKNCETSKNKHKCSPQCDYQDCNYKCKGFPNIELDPNDKLYPKTLDLAELDTSTYAAYPSYYKPEIDKIKRRIKKAFQREVVWSLGQLINEIKKSEKGPKSSATFIEDRFIYLAIHEMIENEEEVENFFKVPGKIIYVGKYYLFQPNDMDQDITVLERAQPSQIKVEQKVNITDYLNNHVTETTERFEKFNFARFREAIAKHSDPAKIAKITTKQDLKIQQDILENSVEFVLGLYNDSGSRLKINKPYPAIIKLKEEHFKSSSVWSEFIFHRKILDAFRDYLIRSDQLYSSSGAAYSYTNSDEILSDPDKTIIGHYLSQKPRCFVDNMWTNCGKDLKKPPSISVKDNEIVVGYLSKDRRNRIVFKLMLPSKEKISDRRKRTRGFVCKQNNDKKILFDIAKKLGIELKRNTQEYICDKIEIELRKRQRDKTEYRWFYDYLEFIRAQKL